MIEFTYRDNRKKDRPVLFKVLAETILKADELFQNHTGINPAKTTYVSVSLNFHLTNAFNGKELKEDPSGLL